MCLMSSLLSRIVIDDPHSRYPGADTSSKDNELPPLM
jgi:hypothetical protein